MKEKLFLVNGSNIAKLGIIKAPYSIFSLDNLKKYIELIEIGDLNDGIELNQLKRYFSSYIDNNTFTLNILLFMHGFCENEEYMLETYKGEVEPAWKVIKELSDATKGCRKKIIAFACYGANLQSELSLFSDETLLFTLSDYDQMTSALDYQGKITSILSRFFIQQGFKFEYLFEAYLFTQKFTNNLPMIGIKYKDSIKLNSINAIAKDYFTQERELKFSEFIAHICKYQIISPIQKAFAVKSLFKYKGDLENFISRENILLSLINHWQGNNINEYIKILEKKYFFPNSLKNFKITFDSRLINCIPEPITDYQEVNISKYCHLYHYITKHNLLEHPLNKEFVKLQNVEILTNEQALRFNELSKMNIIKLCGNYRALNTMLEIDTESRNQIITFEDNNFRLYYNEEEKDWHTIINHDHPINNIMPLQSACMGLVFDLWLQDNIL